MRERSGTPPSRSVAEQRLSIGASAGRGRRSPPAVSLRNRPDVVEWWLSSPRQAMVPAASSRALSGLGELLPGPVSGDRLARGEGEPVVTFAPGIGYRDPVSEHAVTLPIACPGSMCKARLRADPPHGAWIAGNPDGRAEAHCLAGAEPVWDSHAARRSWECRRCATRSRAHHGEPRQRGR